MNTTVRKISKRQAALEARDRSNYDDAVRELSRRVTRGIRFLDKKVGRRDWLTLITEKELELANANACILGQLFGSFGAGVNEYFDGDTDKSAPYGFYFTEEDYANKNQYMCSWDILTKIWVNRITRYKLEGNI